MADITLLRSEEITALNAASITANFNNIRTGVNSIPTYAIAQGAFTQAHLPRSPALAGAGLASWLTNVVPALTVVTDAGGAGHTYYNQYPGNAPVVPHEFLAPVATPDSWQTVDDGVTSLSISFDAVTLASPSAAVLVMADIEFLRGTYDDGAPPEWDPAFLGMFGIYWYRAGPVYTLIPQSVRACSTGAIDALTGYVWYHVCLRQIITATNLGGNAMSRIGACCAWANPTALAGLVPNDAQTFIELGRCRLSIVPLHCRIM